jgi:hypothetical protein
MKKPGPIWTSMQESVWISSQSISPNAPIVCRRNGRRGGYADGGVASIEEE